VTATRSVVNEWRKLRGGCVGSYTIAGPRALFHIMKTVVAARASCSGFFGPPHMTNNSDARPQMLFVLGTPPVW
jgi:hypothetical protein